MKIIKVTGNRVLIQQDQNTKKETESGLIIPESVRMTDETGLQKHITTGKVVFVGGQCKWASPGDQVLFRITDCAPIEFDDQKYLAIRELQIVFAFHGDSITKVNTDRILLEPDPADKITDAGLFIPENANYEPTTGVVIGVGQDCKDIQPLDRILFGKMAGEPIEFMGKKYMCVRESDIVSVVEV